MSEDALKQRAILDGMRQYLQALHREGAVDEFKMKYGGGYSPLEECLARWEIEVPARQ